MEVRAWHPVCSLYWWGPPGTESFITFLDSQLPIGEVTWEHSSVSRILSTSQQHKSFIWNSSEIIEHFSLMIYTLLFSWLSAFFVKKKKKTVPGIHAPHKQQQQAAIIGHVVGEGFLLRCSRENRGTSKSAAPHHRNFDANHQGSKIWDHVYSTAKGVFRIFHALKKVDGPVVILANKCNIHLLYNWFQITYGGTGTWVPGHFSNVMCQPDL